MCRARAARPGSLSTGSPYRPSPDPVEPVACRRPGQSWRPGLQVPRTVRESLNNAFRISRKDSSTEIDAVMTVLGAYAAETAQAQTVPVF